MTVGYFRSLHAIQLESIRRGIEVDFLVTEGESHVTRARNNLVATFLNQTDADTLVFIDADIEIQAEDFFGLLRLKGVRGAAVACKTPDHSELLSVFVDGKSPKRKELGNKRLTVDFLGSAVLAIDRQVFVDLAATGAVSAYVDPLIGPAWEFFWDGVVGTDFLTEDYGFCHTCKKQGITITCDPRIIVSHYGADFWRY
ncbi:MAG: hypothetical protein V3U60_11165 [Gammaproteobacteria bacterium]